MINVEFMKKQIESMDVKSDEFFELFKSINDKYYTFPDPDEFQNCAMLLRMYVDKASNEYESQLITFTKILEQLFMMDKNNTKACMGDIVFKSKSYFFTIATDKKEIKKMQDIMGKVLKGNFKVKGSK